MSGDARERDLRQALNEIADSLCDAAHDDFSARVSVESDDPDAQKLSALVNFLLDRVRRQIEEQRQIAEGLTRALDEVAALSQAKSQFIANMSHELRTPLNAVIGFAEILQKEGLGPLGHPDYRDFVGDIAAAGKHLLAIVNDVLDLAKADARHLTLREGVLDLGRTIGETLRIMAPEAEAGGLTLLAEAAPDAPTLVMGDVGRIRQILLNLLSNAVKFTRPGGRVTVRRELDEAGRLVVTVSDTGIGMRPEEIPRAFERFGQLDGGLDRRRNGTGLGLPLALSLAELHGGTLTLESAPGEGTQARLVLPAVRVARPASDPAGPGSTDQDLRVSVGISSR